MIRSLLYRMLVASIGATILLPAALAQSSGGERTALLWQISGKRLKQPSYLYGTIHTIPQDSFFVTEATKTKMKQSEILMMERDSHSGMVISEMMGAMAGMMLPPPITLRTLLHEDDYLYLRGFMKDTLKSSMAMVNATKPFFVSQQVATRYCSNTSTTSYEGYFSEIFKKSNKKVIGLETVEQQQHLLDSISLETQAAEMMLNVRNPRRLCQQYSDMIHLYRQHDAHALYEFAKQGQADYMNILLDKRNMRWMPTIEKSIRKKPTFIAVGVAHLAGENGLIQLLRNEGYEVKPIQE